MGLLHIIVLSLILWYNWANLHVANVIVLTHLFSVNHFRCFTPMYTLGFSHSDVHVWKASREVQPTQGKNSHVMLHNVSQIHAVRHECRSQRDKRSVIITFYGCSLLPIIIVT